MGLPNSGKTWLANRLGKELSVPTWDADVVRKIYNDWDFSIQGRAVQADRMRTLAELDPVSISAFICPLPALRNNFRPDILIWMDTVQASPYKDTDALFKPPIKIADIRITKWIAENQLYKCLEGFSLGTMDTQSYSNVRLLKLDKCVLWFVT